MKLSGYFAGELQIVSARCAARRFNCSNCRSLSGCNESPFLAALFRWFLLNRKLFVIAWTRPYGQRWRVSTYRTQIGIRLGDFECNGDFSPTDNWGYSSTVRDQPNTL